MRRAANIAAFIVLTLCALDVAAQRPSQVVTPLTYPVSLIRLIANPTAFDGKQISVCGYLDYNGLDKSLGLFVSDVDAHNVVLLNSISVTIEDSKSRSLVKKYVTLSGVFHASDIRLGPNGLIDQISEIKQWPPPM